LVTIAALFAVGLLAIFTVRLESPQLMRVVSIVSPAYGWDSLVVRM